MHRMALKIWTSRNTAHMGRCFRALFGISLGPGAFPTLRPLMAYGTSSGLVNFGSLAGVWRYDSSATSTVSMTAGTEGTVTG